MMQIVCIEVVLQKLQYYMIQLLMLDTLTLQVLYKPKLHLLRIG